ncbi:MAG: DUF7560 family zinc ribbon protein [Halodesulfurarchaeum sp.]
MQLRATPPMQAQSSDTMYQFVCPQCGTTPIVDEDVHLDMLVTGCYICKSSVGESDFRQL